MFQNHNSSFLLQCEILNSNIKWNLTRKLAARLKSLLLSSHLWLLGSEQPSIQTASPRPPGRVAISSSGVKVCGSEIRKENPPPPPLRSDLHIDDESQMQLNPAHWSMMGKF